jgi:FKBP-type peptidyl-prolyl cis-trans isomerase
MRMRKQIATPLKLLTAGLLLLGIAWAQQSSAPSSQQPSTPAPKTQQAPTTKSQKAPATKSATVLTLKTQKDKTSYALGMDLGAKLRSNSVDVDTKILLRGLQDALAGNKTLLTDAERQAVLVQLQNDVRMAQQVKMQQLAEQNKKAGEEFLAANKTKEGVVALPSGLQYKILQPGSGPKPTATDSVVCNYRGTLLDGTEFDSSYKRGQPATFPVNGVIKGWTEALQLMPVGSKWQLFIPAELAYGERGAGRQIGPNSTLIFEVELISIQGKEEKPKQN